MIYVYRLLESYYKGNEKFKITKKSFPPRGSAKSASTLCPRSAASVQNSKLRLPRRYAPRNDTNECNTPKVDSPDIICNYIRFDRWSALILKTNYQ